MNDIDRACPHLTIKQKLELKEIIQKTEDFIPFYSILSVINPKSQLRSIGNSLKIINETNEEFDIRLRKYVP